VTWSERVAELRAVIAAREGKGLRPRVTVKCVSCGQTAVILGPNVEHMELMFPGWDFGTEQPYRDFCPECSRY
jgi:hypothetical protein